MRVPALGSMKATFILFSVAVVVWLMVAFDVARTDLARSRASASRSGAAFGRAATPARQSVSSLVAVRKPAARKTARTEPPLAAAPAAPAGSQASDRDRQLIEGLQKMIEQRSAEVSPGQLARMRRARRAFENARQ